MLARSRLKLHPKPTRSCLIACFGIPCRNTIFHAYGGAYCRRASHATSTMTASKIDGTAIANKIKSRISDDIQKKQSSNPAFKPSLVIIQVGERPDSSTYIRMKRKAADEVNITCTVTTYNEDIREEELLGKIAQLNVDSSVHGILVQLPLPEHISEHAITSAVSDEKDVDGFGASNIGELAKRNGKPRFVPCTPRGVMELLNESGVQLSGKHAVVLGRSDIVGGPISLLLRKADATVTMCHSHTTNVPEFIKQADVLIVAIGKPGYIKGEWLKKDAVVIDVGTNYIPDEGRKSGQRLVGDVDFDSAAETAALITPVPGGVGPMTVMMLLQNVVDSATSILKERRQ